MLKDRGVNTDALGGQIIQLEIYGYLESIYKDKRGIYNLKNWLRRFRLKKQYIRTKEQRLKDSRIA